MRTLSRKASIAVVGGILAAGALVIALPPLLRSAEVPPMVVDVSPAARPAALALGDSLFHYHGARVAYIAVIGDGLLVQLAPGQFAPAVRFSPVGTGCIIDPYPTPALRALARRAWTTFGRGQGVHRVHVAVGSANEVSRWTPGETFGCGSVKGLHWVTFEKADLENVGQ